MAPKPKPKPSPPKPTKIVKFPGQSGPAKRGASSHTLSVPIMVLALLHEADGVDLIEEYKDDMQHITFCTQCYNEYCACLKFLRSA